MFKELWLKHQAMKYLKAVHKGTVDRRALKDKQAKNAAKAEKYAKEYNDFREL